MTQTPIWRLRRLLALLTAVSLLVAACGNDDDTAKPDGDAQVDRDDTGEDDDRSDSGGGDMGSLAEGFAALDPADPVVWTFMVYLVGDTDLEPFALQDLTEMAAVGSNDALNIVVLADRAEGYTDEGVVDQDDWETAKLFQVQPGSLHELADVGELDQGDPDTLADFVEGAITAFPADRYALSVWDHGGGWTGIGPDDSSGDVLELDDLVAGLSSGLSATGVDELDLLGFDACLMATYEVASVLAPYAQYFLASQELEPGHGWDYEALALLAEVPETDGAGLGRAIIDGFAQHAIDNETENDITLSLIDNSTMPALDAAMADFAAALAAQADGLGPVVGRQRANTLEFGRSENPEQSSNLADLGIFVAELGIQSLQVSDQADAVIRAMNDSVVERTAGPALFGATGLSIYFPPTARSMDDSYPAGSIQAAGTWQSFLSAHHGAGAAIPPDAQAAFEDPDALLEIFDADGGVVVEAAFDPASLVNLVDAYISYGVTDPDSGRIILLGDDDAQLATDGSGVVTGFTDLSTFSISDGEDEMLAFISITFDEESGFSTATVPLDYQAPGSDEVEPLEVSIVVDPDGNIVEEDFYVVDEAGTWGEVTLDPDGLVFPVVPILDTDGETTWEAFGPGLFADLPNLAYDFQPLDPGTEIYVELAIEDFGGNIATQDALFDL